MQDQGSHMGRDLSVGKIPTIPWAGTEHKQPPPPESGAVNRPFLLDEECSETISAALHTKAL